MTHVTELTETQISRLKNIAWASKMRLVIDDRGCGHCTASIGTKSQQFASCKLWVSVPHKRWDYRDARGLEIMRLMQHVIDGE